MAERLVETITLSQAKALGDVVRTEAPVRAIRPLSDSVQVAWTEAGSPVEATCAQCIVAVPAYAARSCDRAVCVAPPGRGNVGGGGYGVDLWMRPRLR